MSRRSERTSIFSSARMGDFAWRRRVGALQKLIEGQFLDAGVSSLLSRSKSCAGRLDVDLDTLDDPAWIWPAPAQIDPLAETQADALAVQSGFTSRASVICEVRPRSRRSPRRDRGRRFHTGRRRRRQPNLKVVQNA